MTGRRCASTTDGRNPPTVRGAQRRRSGRGRSQHSGPHGSDSDAVPTGGPRPGGPAGSHMAVLDVTRPMAALFGPDRLGQPSAVARPSSPDEVISVLVWAGSEPHGCLVSRVVDRRLRPSRLLTLRSTGRHQRARHASRGSSKSPWRRPPPHPGASTVGAAFVPRCSPGRAALVGQLPRPSNGASARGVRGPRISRATSRPAPSASASAC